MIKTERLIRIFSILFFVLTLLGCASTKTIESNGMIITTRTKGQIRVQGEASNAKAGACVVTTDENLYYIENKEFWEDSILNKQVEVEGKLETIDTELIDKTRVVAYIKHQNLIKDARIKVLSD